MFGGKKISIQTAVLMPHKPSLSSIDASPKKREKPIQRHETVKWPLYSNDSTKDAKERVIFCQADTNYTAHLKYGYSLKEIAEYLMVYYNTVIG